MSEEPDDEQREAVKPKKPKEKLRYINEIYGHKMPENMSKEMLTWLIKKRNETIKHVLVD